MREESETGRGREGEEIEGEHNDGGEETINTKVKITERK